MSSSGLSKAVLSSPGQSVSRSADQHTTYSSSPEFSARMKVDYTVDYTLSTLQKDNHNKRMKALRKELTNLQTTAWKYQSIDKYIGQHRPFSLVYWQGNTSIMGVFSWFWNIVPEKNYTFGENVKSEKWSIGNWIQNLFYVDEEDAQEEEEAKQVRLEENLRIVNERVAAMLRKNDDYSHHGEETKDTVDQLSGCCLRSGQISQIHNESGTIDGDIYFDMHNAPADLRPGQLVSYLAYRASEDAEWVVRKILPSEEPVWVGEDDDANETQKDPNGPVQQVRRADVQKEVQYRSLIVKVTDRRGREIIVDDGEFRFNLDKVETSFTPMIGDFLYLDAVVERDEDAADLGGAVLDVERIRWVRYKVASGAVTEVYNSRGEGRVGNDVFFNRDACTPGYVPCRGDQVNVDAIESYQGKCTWRALVISPAEVSRKNARVNSNATAVEIQALCQPKQGITIAGSKLDFGVVSMNKAGNVLVVKLKNTGKEKQVLMYGDFYSMQRDCQVSPVRPIEKVTLLPGDSLEYQFGCHGKYIGVSKELFVFCFKGFKVGFYFTVDVRDPESLSMVSSEVANSHSEKRRRHVEWKTNKGTVVLRGERPIVPPKFMAVRRDPYNVPDRYWRAVLDADNSPKSTTEIKRCLQEICPSLGNVLTFLNYREYFHSLLYLEEIDNNLRIQEFDMATVLFQRVGDFLSLDVPGLAEKRPSLLVGDKVYASQPWKDNRLEYEGFIHKTFAKRVWIKFNVEFHLAYTQEVSNVRFAYGRTPIRRQHNAVEDAIDHLGEGILFPTKLSLRPPQVDLDEDPDADIAANLYARPDPTRRTVTWINKTLNFHQKEAVRNVLKGEARPLPYVIFGPPGTGKTITLVETILQIFFLLPNSRLLVATPSNSSANLIAERLLDTGLLKPGDLVRLVGYHVLEEGTLSEKLRPYATTGILKDLSHVVGPEADPTPLGELRETSNRNTLGRHRITVGTCIALGQLVLMDFPQGHFTHVVIDEAGQASEPEIHVPLGFLDQSGQAILAGDPLQLGPVVGSTLAKDYGLGESYLDRLTHRFPYQRDTVGFPTTGGFDPRLVTRLVSNYRSLPEILALPNELFYDSLLVAEVSAVEGPDAELLVRLGEFLPTRDAKFVGPPPILFHGVVGTNLQENDSPSWFNPEEAVTALNYLKVAYACGLTPDDVGVITPYRKQVQKMRWFFSRHGMELPKIGSVEEFQGQERRVVIMSVVRSSREHVDADVHHSLGFVASPKRLNVAITRARSLLVVVGNPHLLAIDPCWRSAIRYCVERQCYTGCEPPLNCLDGRESTVDYVDGKLDLEPTGRDIGNVMASRLPTKNSEADYVAAEAEW